MSTPGGAKRSLTDFFAPVSSPKKARVSPDDAASSSIARPASTVAAGPTDVPASAAPRFDVNVFRDSLSVDRVEGKPSERELLTLECECLHESWLSLLQKEIRMSYFLTLKRFLWQEGLRLPDDASSKTKIFPPGIDCSDPSVQPTRLTLYQLAMSIHGLDTRRSTRSRSSSSVRTPITMMVLLLSAFGPLHPADMVATSKGQAHGPLRQSRQSHLLTQLRRPFLLRSAWCPSSAFSAQYVQGDQERIPFL